MARAARSGYGGPSAKVDLYYDYSKNLHYPRTVLLAAELPPGRHTVTLRIGAETKSAGHAMRIIKFVFSRCYPTPKACLRRYPIPKEAAATEVEMPAIKRKLLRKGASFATLR